MKDFEAEGYYPVRKLPLSPDHKIGVSEEGYPMFFVKCKGECKFIDMNLELISVMFNRDCNISEEGCLATEKHTIILLKTDSLDLKYYFISVVELVLQQFESVPTHKELKTEIDKMIDLFKSISSTPKRTIQGLWAELLLIEQSSDPEYMIRSWHSHPDDKFDFNDSNSKIEVKSTSSARRIHSFALEQLHPNEHAQLLIASIHTIQTGIGLSIIDLRDTIINRVSDLQIQIKLNEIILSTLGRNFESVSDVYFDYQNGIDTLALYSHTDIPVINKDDIPESISEVHFKVDLSNISPLSDEAIADFNSNLFNVL